MRIGILTFHCAHNYGAVLQAYALQEYLSSIGHDVQIIDYRPDYLVKPYAISGERKSFLERVMDLPIASQKRKRHERFEDFISERLNCSTRALNREQLVQDYDAYVVGSDQVWNLRIIGDDRIYFGDFPRAESSALIAYAASTETAQEGAVEDLSEQQGYLQRFSGIGVREDALRDHVQNFVDVNVHTVVDPTLLVEPSVFDSLEANTEMNDFLLVYQVNVYSQTNAIAHDIQKRHGLEKKVKLTPGVPRRDPFNRFASASPEDFVSLYRKAEYVVTTSFHGVVFALIFRKQFVCVMNSSRGNYRISNLLSELGLEDRMVRNVDGIPASAIDYDQVTSRVHVLRKRSREFLAKALAKNE